MSSIAERWRNSELHPARFFLETWRGLDAEAAASRQARQAAGLGYDYRPLIAFSCGAALLTVMWYFGNSRTFFEIVDTWFPALRRSPYLELYRMTYWAMARVIGCLVVPVLILKMTRQSVREHGLSWTGVRQHLWIYVVFFAIVFVGVVVVSFTPTFATYYPFFHSAGRSWLELGVWEFVYAAQFFSLEFFFRGYWLKACRDSMGSQAIFAMVVPYCMLHYGKPVFEAYAAIFAGIVLGTLAMKTRSIWCGFFIHVSVGLSMDLLALLQTTGLPRMLDASALSETLGKLCTIPIGIVQSFPILLFVVWCPFHVFTQQIRTKVAVELAPH